jgi:hypothetical protein
MSLLKVLLLPAALALWLALAVFLLALLALASALGLVWTLQFLALALRDLLRRFFS